MLHDDICSLRGRRGWVDIIVGSPPCQDISTANPRATGIDGARSGLFWEAIRLIEECRPAWGCLENSPAIRVRGYDRLAEALEAFDYACWPLVVGADGAGAPHRRDRAWIVFADATREPGGHGGQPRPGAPAVADAERLQLREQPGGRRGPNGSGKTEPGDAVATGRDPDADRCGQQEQPQRDGGAPSGLDDAMRERREHQDGQRSIDPAKAIRTEFSAPSWATGIPSFEELDDGPTDQLAGNGALYRAICAAQGDAIVPQVALPIVRAMHRLIPTQGRVLDLFAGAVGGWSYAAEWAGLEVVASCEIDPWRREVYAATQRALGPPFNAYTNRQPTDTDGD